MHAWLPALNDQTLDFSYGEVILVIIIIGQPVQLYQGEDKHVMEHIIQTHILNKNKTN